MRAFVFSLDAFIAFTLALVAIYSLVFFSSIPTSYYYLLTQGHYLTKDTLLTLATTDCTGVYSFDCGRGTGSSGSILDAIARSDRDSTVLAALIPDTLGRMIPPQYGYVVESSSDGRNWNTIYDTSAEPSDLHAKMVRKLTVSSQILSFGYSSELTKKVSPPFRYFTCDGSDSASGASSGLSGGLITCGNFLNSPYGGGGGGSGPYGNTVPSINAKVIRLTVFI